MSKRGAVVRVFSSLLLSHPQPFSPLSPFPLQPSGLQHAPSSTPHPVWCEIVATCSSAAFADTPGLRVSGSLKRFFSFFTKVRFLDVSVSTQTFWVELSNGFSDFSLELTDGRETRTVKEKDRWGNYTKKKKNTAETNVLKGAGEEKKKSYCLYKHS